MNESILNARQPDPTPNGYTPSWQSVIDEVTRGYEAPAGDPLMGLLIVDMQERDRLGTVKYGVRLQPHNGRDGLVDAYQEALDLVVYLWNARCEASRDDGDAYVDAKTSFICAVRLAMDIRRQIRNRDGRGV